MPRKKKGSYHGPEIFPVSPSNDPITNLLSEAGNVLAGGFVALFGPTEPKSVIVFRFPFDLCYRACFGHT